MKPASTSKLSIPFIGIFALHRIGADWRGRDRNGEEWINIIGERLCLKNAWNAVNHSRSLTESLNARNVSVARNVTIGGICANIIEKIKKGLGKFRDDTRKGKF
jgi:hypothetical protein